MNLVFTELQHKNSAVLLFKMSFDLYQARNVSSVRLFNQGLSLVLCFLSCVLLFAHIFPCSLPDAMHDIVRVRIRVRLYFILFYFKVKF